MDNRLFTLSSVTVVILLLGYYATVFDSGLGRGQDVYAITGLAVSANPSATLWQQGYFIPSEPTDDEDVVINFKRNVDVNTVNLVVDGQVFGEPYQRSFSKENLGSYITFPADHPRHVEGKHTLGIRGYNCVQNDCTESTISEKEITIKPSEFSTVTTTEFVNREPFITKLFMIKGSAENVAFDNQDIFINFEKNFDVNFVTIVIDGVEQQDTKRRYKLEMGPASITWPANHPKHLFGEHTVTVKGYYCTPENLNTCKSGELIPAKKILIDNPDIFCDKDGDKYFSTQCQTGNDCDDKAPVVNPGTSNPYCNCDDSDGMVKGAEKCDGLDNDCDGYIDEEFNTDGDAYSTCMGDCDDNNKLIHPGATELCDSVDQNCNSDPFDGTNCEQACTTPTIYSATSTVTFAKLAEKHPACTKASAGSSTCKAAINRECISKGFESGFGLIERSENDGKISCISKGGAKLFKTTFANLGTFYNECNFDNRVKEQCSPAINKFCIAKGYESGFGVVEHGGEEATVVCTYKNAAKTFNSVDMAEITAKHSSCTPTNLPSDECNSAFKRYCESKGYHTGFGPVEQAEGKVSLTCIKEKADTTVSLKKKIVQAVLHSNGKKGWERTCPMDSTAGNGVKWEDCSNWKEVSLVSEHDPEGHTGISAYPWESSDGNNYLQISTISTDGIRAWERRCRMNPTIGNGVEWNTCSPWALVLLEIPGHEGKKYQAISNYKYELSGKEFLSQTLFTQDGKEGFNRNCEMDGTKSNGVKWTGCEWTSFSLADRTPSDDHEFAGQDFYTFKATDGRQLISQSLIHKDGKQSWERLCIMQGDVKWDTCSPWALRRMDGQGTLEPKDPKYADIYSYTYAENEVPAFPVRSIGKWSSERCCGNTEGDSMKYSPDNCAQGCCPQTSCYDDRTKNCIANGKGSAAFYCVLGRWTSKTNIVAKILDDYKKDNSITQSTLFCGSYNEVLNNYDYLILQKVAEDYFRGNCAASSSTIPCSSNLCALEFGGKVIIGGSLSFVPTKVQLKEFLGHNEDCTDAAIAQNGKLEPCSGTQSKLWFNANSGIFIYGTDSITLKQKDINLVAPIIEQPLEKLYRLSAGTRQVEGDVFTSCDSAGSKNEETKLTYTNIGADVCDATKALTQGCKKEGTKQTIESKHRANDASALFGFWQSLTARLRIK